MSSGVTHDDLRQIAQTLPETEFADGDFSVNNKGYAWIYRQKIAGVKGRVFRADVLAVRVAGEVEKQGLISSAPGTFFTDDHYKGYPAVLIHLSEIDLDEVTELLTDAWRLRAPKKLAAAFDARQPSS